MDQFGRFAFLSPGPNGTVGWSLTVDGSSGAFAFANATTGSVSLRNAGALDYESGVTSYTLVVTAASAAVPTQQGSGTLTILVLDAPDYPTVPPNQALAVTDYAVKGAVFSPPLIASLQDTGNYTANLSYRLLPPGPAATAACGLPPNVTEYPTTTGLVGGVPLFAVHPTTGVINVSATPTGVSWPLRPLTPYLNNFTRALYQVCLNVSTKWKSTVRAVVLEVVADVSNIPTITALAVGAANATSGVGYTDTLGGTPVFFIGSGFPLSIPPVGVNASLSNGAVTFNATGCSILSPTALSCTAPPGFGGGHVWSIFIARSLVPQALAQSGSAAPTPLTTSYAPPRITGLFNVTALPSSGGTEIWLSGRYFSSVPQVVTLAFGPGSSGGGSSSVGASNPSFTSDGSCYASSTAAGGVWPLQYACAALVTPGWSASRMDSWVRCVAPPGAGTGLQWVLTVGGQVGVPASSDVAALTIAYAPPVITSLSTGGANGSVSSYTLATLPTSGVVAGTGTPATVTLRGSGFGGNRCNGLNALYGSFALTGCVRPPLGSGGAVDSTVMTCAVSPGVGAGLGVSISVDGSAPSSAVNASYGSAGSLVLSYAPPSVSALSGSVVGIPTVGGTTLAITGTQFGPLGSAGITFVQYGPPASISRYQLRSDACAVTAVGASSSRIECTTLPGTGAGYALQLSIGGQPTPLFTSGNISYAPPVVAGFSGPGAAGADTRGGLALADVADQTVVISGVGFGPLGSPLAVSYSTTLRDGPVGTAVFTAVNCSQDGQAPQTTLLCTTAEGAGKALAWAVVVDGQVSVQPTTDYAPPFIATITGAGAGGGAVDAANPLGGDALILSGLDFGPSFVLNSSAAGAAGAGPAASTLLRRVSYGPTGVQHVLNSSQYALLSHTAIAVTLGPGTGSNLIFQVEVADQVSTSDPTAVFSFAPPSIAWLSPSNGATYSPPSAPTYITVGLLNFPLNDPLSVFRLTFGVQNRR